MAELLDFCGEGAVFAAGLLPLSALFTHRVLGHGAKMTSHVTLAEPAQSTRQFRKSAARGADT